MTAARAYNGFYKHRSTGHLRQPLQSEGGAAHRAVTCAFTTSDAGTNPTHTGERCYKRRYSEGYSQLNATAAGPVRRIGRTKTEMVGRTGHSGRTSRTCRSPGVSGGIW